MATDPVAAKSGFLCMYMSNHPDTLVSYVRYWGKVSDTVVSAQMTSIDTKVRALSWPFCASYDLLILRTCAVTVGYDAEVHC